MNRITLLTLLACALSGCQSEVKVPPSADLDLAAALKGLSDLARAIDSGESTLSKVRAADGRPDPLLSALRRSVAAKPENAEMLLAYLRSSDEPIASRTMAVLALSHCWQPHVMDLIRTLLTGPPDEKLAVAYLRSYWIVEFKDEPDWSDLLPALRGVGLSPAYEYFRPGGEFGGFGGWLASIPETVDSRPVLEGLLTRMDRMAAGDATLDGFGLACELSKRSPREWPDLRSRFRPMLEKVYTGEPSAWRLAMETLMASGRPPDHEILCRGLARRDFPSRMEALDEIGSHCRGLILQDRFRKYLEEILEYLSNLPEAGGPAFGQHDNLLWTLLDQGRDQGWPERLLVKSPSVGLRRRAAQRLEWILCMGSLPSAWPPWLDYLRRMLDDPDLGVQISAVAALINGFQARSMRTGQECAFGDQVEAWRRRLLEWFERAPQGPAPGMEARLGEIRRRLGSSRK